MPHSHHCYYDLLIVSFLYASKGGRKARQNKKSKPRRRTQRLAPDSDSDEGIGIVPYLHYVAFILNFVADVWQPKRVCSVADSPEQSSPVVEESPVRKPDSPPLKLLEKPRRKRMKKLKSNSYINEDGEFGKQELYCYVGACGNMWSLVVPLSVYLSVYTYIFQI